jgi:hypothetical protein
LKKTNLATYIKNEYTVANGNLFQEDESGEDEPEETEEV